MSHISAKAAGGSWYFRGARIPTGSPVLAPCRQMLKKLAQLSKQSMLKEFRAVTAVPQLTWHTMGLNATSTSPYGSWAVRSLQHDGKKRHQKAQWPRGAPCTSTACRAAGRTMPGVPPAAPGPGHPGRLDSAMAPVAGTARMAGAAWRGAWLCYGACCWDSTNGWGSLERSSPRMAWSSSISSASSSHRNWKECHLTCARCGCSSTSQRLWRDPEAPHCNCQQIRWGSADPQQGLDTWQALPP